MHMGKGQSSVPKNPVFMVKSQTKYGEEDLGVNGGEWGGVLTSPRGISTVPSKTKMGIVSHVRIVTRL